MAKGGRANKSIVRPDNLLRAGSPQIGVLLGRSRETERFWVAEARRGSQVSHNACSTPTPDPDSQLGDVPMEVNNG
jgi:hypothetical protein